MCSFNRSNFFLGIIFSINRFLKKTLKKLKSRDGNRLVLPHASYSPDNTKVIKIHLLVTSKSSGNELIPQKRERTERKKSKKNQFLAPQLTIFNRPL